MQEKIIKKFLKKVFTNKNFYAMIWTSKKKNTRRCIDMIAYRSIEKDVNILVSPEEVGRAVKETNIKFSKTKTEKERSL